MIYVHFILLVLFHAQMMMRISDKDKNPKVFFDIGLVVINGCMILLHLKNSR